MMTDEAQAKLVNNMTFQSKKFTVSKGGACRMCLGCAISARARVRRELKPARVRVITRRKPSKPHTKAEEDIICPRATRAQAQVKPWLREPGDEFERGARLSSPMVRARVCLGLSMFYSIKRSVDAYRLNNYQAPEPSCFQRYVPDLWEAMVRCQRRAEAMALKNLALRATPWTLSVDGSWGSTSNLQSHTCVGTFAAHGDGVIPGVFMVRLVQRPAANSTARPLEKVVSAKAKNLERIVVRSGLEALRAAGASPQYVVVDGDVGLHDIISEYLPSATLAADRNHLTRSIGKYFEKISRAAKSDLRTTVVIEQLKAKAQHEAAHERAYADMTTKKKITPAGQLVDPALCVDAEYVYRSEAAQAIEPAGHESTSAHTPGGRRCLLCKQAGHSQKKCPIHSLPSDEAAERIAAAEILAQQGRSGIPAGWISKFVAVVLHSATQSCGNRDLAMLLCEASFCHYGGDHTGCAHLSKEVIMRDSLPTACQKVSRGPLRLATVKELIEAAKVFFGPSAEPMLTIGLMLEASTNINESFHAAMRADIGKGRGGLRLWGLPIRGKLLDLVLGRERWRAEVWRDLKISPPPHLVKGLERQDKESRRKMDYRSSRDILQLEHDRKAGRKLFHKLLPGDAAQGHTRGVGLPSVPATTPSAGSKRTRG